MMTSIDQLEGCKAPLSFQQRQMWILHKLAPDSPVYNIPAAVHFDRELDTTILQRCLDEIVHRHESLRTRFVLDGEVPVQEILPEAIVGITRKDLSSLTAEDREDALEKYLQEESRRAFRLSTLPLLRVSHIRLCPGEEILFVVMHHAIADGWSLSILFHEWEALYNLYDGGKTYPLIELPFQCKDYAEWQRSAYQEGRWDQDLRYWKGQLGDAPEALDIPTDFVRSEKPRFQGAAECFDLPRSVSDVLVRLGRQVGASIHMTMLATYACLLHRYSGKRDILIGTPSANRDAKEFESLIGFLANLLVIRIDLAGDPSFVELLGRTRSTALDAYEHQAIPFELLVDKLKPSRNSLTNPFVQASFAMVQKSLPSSELESSWPMFHELDTSTFKFDLGMVAVEEESGYKINLVYNPDLFRRETCVKMMELYQRLLLELIKHPETGISSLSILTAKEKEIVEQWQANGTEYTSACIHELFAKRIQKNPNAIAVIYPEVSLTYRELDQRANSLAATLRSRGLRIEQSVGICMKRSWQFVVALLAVLKAGGSCLPLDPDYPDARLQLMLKETCTTIVITDSHTEGRFSEEIRSLYGFVAFESAAESSSDPCNREVDSRNLAYIFYTSGSTGLPKGIMIPHRAVVRIACNQNFISVREGDRIAQASNISFDAAIFEVWGALLNGACLVGLSKEDLLDPDLFALQVRKNKISVMFLTTSLFHQFVSTEQSAIFAELRCLLFGGEAADPRLVQEVLQYSAPSELLNVYGPTENTTFSTYHLIRTITTKTSSVPIGVPVANTQAYVLSESLTPVPSESIGELYLSGDGLARGYWSRPDLTAEAFFPNPFSSKSSDRMYKTGDLVRYSVQGRMEYVGRKDQQVKLRGMRIELEEIEVVLRQHPSVREGAVLVKNDQRDKRLIAYVVGPSDSDVNELRTYLRDSLPGYMVPAQVIALGQFPLTENGKLDKLTLLDLAAEEKNAERSGEHGIPEDSLDRLVLEVWRDVLGADGFGLHDNIFEHGGHSLLIIQMYSRLQKRLPDDSGMTLSDIFLYPSVASLTEVLRSRRPVQMSN